MNIFSKLMFLASNNSILSLDVKKVMGTTQTTWYLTTSDDLYGCGYNSSGQQGSGDATDVTTFTKRASNVKDFACSSYTTLYLTTSGDLYGCGKVSNVKIFTKIASNVKDFACSTGTTWYIDNNGDLYGCGEGRYGQQGSGSTSRVTTFTKRASNVKDFACSDWTTWYIDSNDDLYGCGYNSSGQQGSGNLSNVLTFTKRTPPSVIYNYGFRIDTENSDPTSAITYIDDSKNFTPASMDFTTGTLDYGSWENAFFQPRPVMLKYDGTVDYELDHNDFTKKLDGSASDVSNTSYDGNCMIAWPQVWLKFRESNNIDGSTNDSQGRYQFVNVANWNVDGNYHCYAHYNNNGVLLDEIYTAAFEPSNISSKLRSLAGQTVLTRTAGTTMRTYAQANGDGWDFLDVGTIRMIQMLFILMFKSRDSQSKAGAGIVRASTVSSTTGSTKDKGMFYSTVSDAASSTATVPFKFFGIENLWGNCHKWINGLTCYGTKVFYKLCNYTVDGSTAIGYSPTRTSPGYKSYTGTNGNRTLYNLGMPNTSDGIMWHWPSSGYPIPGANSTQYCDKAYCNLDSSNTNVGCAYFGGAFGEGAIAGLFRVDLTCYGPLSYSSFNFGASLSCKPL